MTPKHAMGGKNYEYKILSKFQMLVGNSLKPVMPKIDTSFSGIIFQFLPINKSLLLVMRTFLKLNNVILSAF